MTSNQECSRIKGIRKCSIDVVTFTASKLFRKKYIPNQVQIHEELKWNAHKIVTEFKFSSLVLDERSMCKRKKSFIGIVYISMPQDYNYL